MDIVTASKWQLFAAPVLQKSFNIEISIALQDKKNVVNWRQIVANAANCGKFWWILVNCGELWWIAANCGKLQQIVANCGKLRQIAANCGKLRQFAANCGKLRQTFGKLRQIGDYICSAWLSCGGSNSPAHPLWLRIIVGPKWGHWPPPPPPENVFFWFLPVFLGGKTHCAFDST